MQWLLILPGYFLWHYTLAFRDIWHLWMNAFWAINRIFSIPLLLKTLFATWKRIVETEGKKFDLEDWAERKVVNLMSRFVGAIVRIPVILIGLVSFLATFLIGIFLYLFWVIAPVAIALLFLSGVYLLF
jgi:hypothetical protein